MSTILDALRKLQRERAAESPSRDLRGSITTESPKGRARKRGGRSGWIAALVLLLALGGGGYWLVQSGRLAGWSEAATGSVADTGGASEAELAEAEREAAALPVEPERAPQIEGSAVALPTAPIQPPTPAPVETSDSAVERARLDAALANARAAQEDAAAAELEASRQAAREAQAAQAKLAAQAPPTQPITAEAAAPAAIPAAPSNPKPAATKPAAPKPAAPKPATRSASTPKPRVEPARAAAPPSTAFPDVRVESIRWHPSPERRVASLHFEQQDAPEAREGDIVAGVLIYRIDPGAVELHVGSAQRVVSPEP